MLKQVPEQGRVRQTLWESTHIARWTAISLWIVQQSLWQEASANIPPSDDTCSPCRQEVRVLHLSKEVGCLNPKSLNTLDMNVCFCVLPASRYVYMSLLQNHLRTTHNSQPTHICDVCAKSFKSAHSYEHHYEVEHSQSTQRAQCEQCGKWFGYWLLLT